MKEEIKGDERRRFYQMGYDEGEQYGREVMKKEIVEKINLITFSAETENQETTTEVFRYVWKIIKMRLIGIITSLTK